MFKGRTIKIYLCACDNKHYKISDEYYAGDYHGK